MPVGTYGKITTNRDGAGWMASCQFRDVDGRVRKVRCWADGKAKAANKLRERVKDRQIAIGEITSDSKVVEVADRWLAEFRELVDAGKRSGTSYDTYEQRWRTVLRPRVEGLRVDELTPGRGDQIIHGIDGQYSASTARTCRAVLSGLCGLAVRHGALKVNPVREARPIENRKRSARPRALTVDEVLGIFAKADGDEIACRQDLPDLMRYFGGTGNRTGETIAVRWELIDFEEKVAWVDGNMVRSKVSGKKVNEGKSENAQRGIGLGRLAGGHALGSTGPGGRCRGRTARGADRLGLSEHARRPAGVEQPAARLAGLPQAAWHRGLVHAPDIPAYRRHPGHGRTSGPRSQ
nr:site-specific integrase [Prauserella cavernicola]